MQPPPPGEASPELRAACYLGNACGTVMQHAVAVLEGYRARLARELDAEVQRAGKRAKRRVPSKATEAQKATAYVGLFAVCTLLAGCV